MTKYFRKYLILLFFALSSGIFAQNVDPSIIIDSAQAKLQNVISYSADALIELDVDFLQMQPKTAKITYEYPNKLNVETEGFSMIPKYGLRPFMKSLAQKDNLLLFTGMEEIDGNNCFVIKLLPLADGKTIMIKLWVRSNDYLVARSETFTRRSGSYLIDFKYDKLVLPSSLIFNFETSGINIPWKFIGNSIEIDKEKMKDEVKTGKVFINFSNYKIQYNN
jgi:hypothetical protein